MSVPPLPKPTPAQLAASQADGIIAGNVIVATLATIAVALRLLARQVQKIGFGADDYLILLALVSGVRADRCFELTVVRKALRLGDVCSHNHRYKTLDILRLLHHC